jgi:hypothetical protein
MGFLLLIEIFVFYIWIWKQTLPSEYKINYYFENC